MSKITDEGLDQVEQAYSKAVDDYDKAAKELEAAMNRMSDLSLAMDCEHIDLEDASTEGTMQTRCKSCGFIWLD